MYIFGKLQMYQYLFSAKIFNLAVQYPLTETTALCHFLMFMFRHSHNQIKVRERLWSGLI